uniref:Group II intron maturase-specific domain-containing protein n=1 Tax=Glaukea argentea TaxID=2894057 RepID=A0A386B1M7_9CHLO|nr:hypothetical protein [Udotea argentea]AYC65557.1 hypothetical protein [Udotea argentea]
MKRPWFYGYGKLLKIQKAIKYNAKKNIRSCRNYQRLLRRSSFIQLLIINEILQDNLNLLEVNFNSKKYRQFLKNDIIVRLWIFALFPILDNQKSLTYLKLAEIYKIFCLYLKKPFVQYVFFCKFSSFFSKKNKYWIMSNISVEKKFFLNSFTLKKKMNYQKKLFSLKQIFKQLTILHFQTNFKISKKIQKSKLRYSSKKNFCLTNSLFYNQIESLEYNNILIFFLEKEFKNMYDPKIYGLNLQFNKFYLLKNGINFLGWFFKKNANYLNVKINQKNFHNYKKEIKKYFNTNQPIDKIIYNINNKILNWKKFYNPTKRYINDYFFWQIWYWIKKHSRRKSFKYLYNYYWKKSTSFFS